MPAIQFCENLIGSERQNGVPFPKIFEEKGGLGRSNGWGAQDPF